MKRHLLPLALLLVILASAAHAGQALYSNATQTNVAAPAGVANATAKMVGLAGTITPLYTGTIVIVISGDVFNATAIADGAKIQGSYGTGTAPVNGATLTGTQCGGLSSYVASTTAGSAPFSVNCVVTGLTVGTAYWLDLSLAYITSGTATVENVSVSAYEL